MGAKKRRRRSRIEEERKRKRREKNNQGCISGVDGGFSLAHPPSTGILDFLHLNPLEQFFDGFARSSLCLHYNLSASNGCLLSLQVDLHLSTDYLFRNRRALSTMVWFTQPHAISSDHPLSTMYGVHVLIVYLLMMVSKLSIHEA